MSLRTLDSGRRASARISATVASFTVCMALGCGGQGEQGGPIVLKLGHVGAPGSLYDDVATEFARRVAERLPAEVEISVFGSSQLGGDELLMQKLKLGTVDISLPSTVMSSTIDEFGLFEMPYLVRDRDHMRRIEDELFWSELAPLAEQAGYTILAVWENGFRHITNSRRPIRTPRDLRGIKLRTPRGIWRVKLFQGYGANPTPMPLSEVFIALQTGVMDGQENPLAQIYSSKLHEVQDYLSLTGHVYTPAFVTVASNRWARLPVGVRAALAEVARDMQSYVYQTAADLDARILASLRSEGIEVNEADADAFIAATGPIYEEFGNEVPGGADLIERATALAVAVDSLRAPNDR